jgi:hypothetical protein
MLAGCSCNLAAALQTMKAANRLLELQQCWVWGTGSSCCCGLTVAAACHMMQRQGLSLQQSLPQQQRAEMMHDCSCGVKLFCSSDSAEPPLCLECAVVSVTGLPTCGATAASCCGVCVLHVAVSLSLYVPVTAMLALAV